MDDTHLDLMLPDIGVDLADLPDLSSLVPTEVMPVATTPEVVPTPVPRPVQEVVEHEVQAAAPVIPVERQDLPPIAPQQSGLQAPQWRGMADAAIPTRVSDVIRDAARETGADADYLKLWAHAESSFKADAASKTSSAKGLFQFTDPTWGDAIKRYGVLYGVQNSNAFDPRASALMAARVSKDHYDILQRELGRKPTYAEQYSMVFLGASGGPRFLKALEANPQALATSAADPAAVDRNTTIFFKKDGSPRTLQELNDLFASKMKMSEALPPAQINDVTAKVGVGSSWGTQSQVKGFIIHHTAGGGNVDGVIETLRQRNLGVQYVIDREGQIHQLLPDRAVGRHMRNGWGELGVGLDNTNTVGVEVIAKNDKDVLPVQVAAAQSLAVELGRKYGFNPATSTWGHGQVNPGHKQHDEGMTIVKAIRSGQPAPDLTTRTDPKAPINPQDVWAAPPVPLDSRYTDAALEAKRMKFREERMGFWSGLGQSLTTTELTARGVRALTSRGFTPDPNYTGTPEHKLDMELLTQNLPESYIPRFANAVSREHMAEIARVAHAENLLNQKLDEAGFKGSAARVAASLVDPGTLGIGLLTGGLGYEAAAGMKLGQITSRLMAGTAGAVGNVATEALSDSLVGQPTEPNHLTLAAALGFSIGAALGPIGRNIATRREALELEAQAQRMYRNPVQDNVIPFPNAEVRAAAEVDMAPRGQSAGAAVNTHATPEVLSDPAFRAIKQESVPLSATDKLNVVRFSEGGKAAISENPIVRMIGGLLGIDMTGKRGLAVNPISADQEMARYFRTKQYDWRSVATPAYQEWATAQGENWIGRTLGKGWQEFNEQVVAFVKARDPAVIAAFPEPIKRAGLHYRKMMAQMLDDQQNPWKSKNGKLGGSVAGSENLMPDPHYVMRVWSVSKLNHAIEQFGHNGVMRVVAASIKSLQPHIDDDLAEKFAGSILQSRFTRTMGYDDRLSGAIGNADTAILGDMLRREFNWSEDEIRRLLDQLRKTEPNAPAHLKHRIQLDENYRMTDVNGYGTGSLGVSDLTENHADLLMQYYSRKVAGRVSLAQQRFVNPLNGEVVIDGIKSDADFEVAFRRAQQWGIENGTDPAQLNKELEGLRWMYDRIKGTPDPAQLSEWAEWLRVAKNYNFARMMGQIGFAQMMDTGRIVGTLGIKSFSQQMRGFKRIVDMDGRSVLRHGLDHELEALFGLGTDRLRGFVAMVWDEAGQVKSASRGRVVDKANAVSEGLANVTAEVSGMHYINSWLQLMVGRGAAQKFANMATGRLSRSDMRMIRFLGIDEKAGPNGAPSMLDRVLTAVRDPQNGFTHEQGFLFGRRVAKMNLDKWTDTEARAAFESALFRWSRHIVQENDIGSLHRMMSHPIAQTLMQFRSYSMTAWENQLLHGMANPDGRTFAQFSASMMSGALVYAAQTQLQAIGRSDADKFLEKKFAPGAFGAAVFQRAGFSSLIPMLVDTASVFTPAGPVFDARPSGQATDFIFGNPFFSLVDDARKTSSAILGSTFGNRELSQTDLRQMARTLFLQNTMPIMQGYSLLIHDQPERRGR